MRLARSGQPSYEKPSIVLDDGARRDVSILISEIDEATLGGPWNAALETIDLGTLPPVAPHARLAAAVERIKRVLRISGDSSAFEAELRLGNPAGAEDDWPLICSGLGSGFVVSAGVAIIMGDRAKISGLSLYTDILPSPSGNPGADRLRCSRHSLWALGPYILGLKEAAEIARVAIWLSAGDGSASTAIEISCELSKVGALADTVDHLCPMEAGDILLLETAGLSRLVCHLKVGDKVEAAAGRFGRHSRRIVQGLAAGGSF